MSGYSPDDWPAEDINLIHELSSDSLRILRKPFSSRDLISSARELIGAPQKPEGAAQGVRAIDETEERERVITALERQAGLLELAHDAIIVRDLAGRILYWNRGAEELYGWTREQAIGRLSHDLLETGFPVPF